MSFEEMPFTYDVAGIRADQIDQAFPIVRLGAPALNLEDWRIFCSNALSNRNLQSEFQDVIVATSPRGYIHGLGIVSVNNHIIHGRLLDVSILVVASAVNSSSAAHDLLSYLKILGRAKKCERIRIWTLEQDWSRQLRAAEVQNWDHGIWIRLAPNTDPPISGSFAAKTATSP